MAAAPTPEVKEAIAKGAIIEAVLVAIGVAIAMFTGQFYWIVGFALVGSLVLVALLAQAGAFRDSDER